jgi:hypothetical protein
MKENTDKNKTKRVVVWPTTSYFTFSDLLALNPEYNEVKITLRVKLTKAIEEEGKYAEIGFVPGNHGRPPKVYATVPVTKLVLDKAEQEGVQLVDRAREKFINVVSVTDSVSMTSIPTNISSLKAVAV